MEDRRKTNGLSEVGVAIGRLQAEAEAGKQQRLELFQQNEKLRAEVGELKTQIAQGFTKLDEATTGNTKRFEKQCREIESLKVSRNRARIAIASIGGASGSLGGIVAAILHKIGLN